MEANVFCIPIIYKKRLGWCLKTKVVKTPIVENFLTACTSRILSATDQLSLHIGTQHVATLYSIYV